MLNSITIMGRLTADPERKGNAVPIAKFAIACQRDYAKQGEEKKTDFIDCVAFGKTADFILKHFAKGMLVALEGRMQTDTYTTATGESRKFYEIAVNNAYFAEAKRSSTTYAQPSVYESDLSEDEFDGEDLPF